MTRSTGRAPPSPHSCILAKQLAPSVRIDLSAMTTLAALQLRGGALIPD